MVVVSRFPNVRRMTVSDVNIEEDVQLLARPDIRDAVTDMVLAHAPSSATHLRLPEFRNLTSLAFVDHTPPNRFSLPTTLEELVLDHPAPIPHGDDLNCLTRLTSLRISILPITFHPPDRPVMIFRALHKLDITCKTLYIPGLQMLTQLTHLTWEGTGDESSVEDLSPFTHLQKLVHLGIKAEQFRGTRQSFKCLARMPALRSVDLQIRSAIVRWGRLPGESLPPLPLTHLGLSLSFMRLGVLPRMTVEGLQDLSLESAFFLEDNEIRGLRQATGLARLEVIMKSGRSYYNRTRGLQEAISGMSRLQALSLHVGNAGISCLGSVRKLTGLTQLRWAGVHISNADVKACAHLKGLRELSLSADPYAKSAPPCAITREAFEDLAKLPQLTKLELSHSLGIRVGLLTDEDQARLNAGRHVRGWPPLDLTNAYWYKYRKTVELSDIRFGYRTVEGL
jgi:hypothetical protein